MGTDLDAFGFLERFVAGHAEDPRVTVDVGAGAGHQEANGRLQAPEFALKFKEKIDPVDIIEPQKGHREQVSTFKLASTK